jgi:serine/threonine protein kinase
MLFFFAILPFTTELTLKLTINKFQTTFKLNTEKLRNVIISLTMSLKDYEVINKLGAGSFGVVYKAKHKKSTELCVIK